MDLDMKLKLLSGLPMEITNAGIAHPILLSDIAKMGYTKYSQMMYVATLDAKDVLREEDLDKFKDVTTFDLIFALGSEDIKNVFYDLMKLIFRVDEIYFSTTYGVLFLCGLNDIKQKMNENRFISRENYDQIREYVEGTNCIERKKLDFVPADEKARELAEKFRKNKEKIAKIKSRNSGESESDFSDVISSVSVKSNISLTDIWKLTVFQLYNEYKRINAVDNYELAIQSILAGADSNKINVKHWSVGLE